MKKLIICNFKMNGSVAMINNYRNQLLNHTLLTNLQNSQLIICPPFPYLSLLQNQSNINLGAQNCSHLQEKSSTGEIDANMLQDLNCQFVIIGHNERRIKLHETSEQINEKISQALQNGLKVILCVGDIENHTENEQGINTAIDYILDQCANSLSDITDDQMQNIIIAYEPVWAIGSGMVPELSYIKKIINILKQNFPASPVCYGGSVNSNNASDILSLSDGILLGKASLDVDEMLKIIQQVENN